MLGLVWLAAAIRLNAVRRAATFTNGAFATSTCAIAVACTLKVTAETTGPTTQGDLPEHASLVVAAVAAQLLLLSLKNGRPERKAIAVRVGTAAVVLGLMAVTYALSEQHPAADVTYRLAFHAYLSLALIESIRLCLRYSRTFHDAGRKLNIVLIGWGAAVGLLYSGSRLLYLLVDQTIQPNPTAIHTAGTAAALVGVSGIALGVLAPRTVRWVQRWAKVSSASRRIEPLWRDLTEAFPDVTLPVARPTSVRQAELRHHRRLLEVAEGLNRAHIGDVASPGDLRAVATALHDSKHTWAAEAGPTAQDLLPHAGTADDERHLLLDLADCYRTIRDHPHAISPGVHA